MLSFKTSSTCFANLFRFNFSPLLVTKSRAILKMAEVENKCEFRQEDNLTRVNQQKKDEGFQTGKKTDATRERSRRAIPTFNFYDWLLFITCQLSIHAHFRLAICPSCFSSKRPVLVRSWRERVRRAVYSSKSNVKVKNTHETGLIDIQNLIATRHVNDPFYYT